MIVYLIAVFTPNIKDRIIKTDPIINNQFCNNPYMLRFDIVSLKNFISSPSIFSVSIIALVVSLLTLNQFRKIEINNNIIPQINQN